jgi:hypothetical protein
MDNRTGMKLHNTTEGQIGLGDNGNRQKTKLRFLLAVRSETITELYMDSRFIRNSSMLANLTPTGS